MFNKLRTLLVALSITIFATVAMASSYNNVDISSGIKADMPGNPMYNYSEKDLFWQVVKTPDNSNLGDAYIPNVTVGTFTAYTTIPNTRYINSNQTDTGIYEYQRCFCLDSPEKAVMSVTLRADNTAKVFLNNYSNEIISIPHNDSFKKAPGIAKVDEGFLKGKNCIRVRVNNSGSITAMDAKASVEGWGAKEVADKCCSVTSKLFDGKASVGKRPPPNRRIRINPRKRN